MELSVNIPVEYLAPAIATGNTVVWVPAPTTSLCAVELMRCLVAGGLEAGVVNLVIGEGPVAGDEAVAHPEPTPSASPAVRSPAGASLSARPASRCCSSRAETAR